jgi:hypothetical protein
MRTPGHVVLNLFLLGRGRPGLAVLAGAALPDLPIALLYGYERLRGTPEERIWSEAYQRPLWQALIHGAHSFPLALAGLGASALARSKTGLAFFSSMALHSLGDLPLHGEDAHRHFFPLSDWRFESPISYWDVRRHARVAAAAEAAAVAFAARRLARHTSGAATAALAAVSLWYVDGYLRTFVFGDGRWRPYF